MQIRIFGYTMAEILVVLGLIGVMSALILPNIARVGPNKESVMFRKAYYTTEKIVYELYNDETLYPPSSDKVGFANTEEVYYNNVSYGGIVNYEKKFCQLFGVKLNVAENNSDPITGCHYKTSDGLAWDIPNSDFSSADYITITTRVPISGKDAAGNPRLKDYCIKVYKTGKVVPSNCSSPCPVGRICGILADEKKFLKNAINMSD